jgi:glycosyltransferase involved in cell wall biosynthesis
VTRETLVSRYGVALDKVDVVHNGVRQAAPVERPAKGPDDDNVVLFLGRVTMQKGPEYFVAAAKRVLEVMDNVKFIVAGTGDLWRRMVELAAEAASATASSSPASSAAPTCSARSAWPTCT